MKSLEDKIDYYEFGKRLYETAINNFIDTPGIREVEIPLQHPEYNGSIITFKASQPAQFIDREGYDSVTYYVKSDGTLQEKYRMKGFYRYE